MNGRAMMAARLAPMLALTLALPACGQKAEQPAAANAVAPESGAAAQVAKLDPSLRDGVFQKAIKASGAAPLSGATALAPGVRGWRVHCDNDSAHLIEILPDGTAKVTSRRD
ncbi:hypothetical protein [Sphingobium sp. CCH11-B1]|uniref:hypothetical protein n=1 Tax=Sphingobium sp. CCH11-B1 TaxID=1768781 RepID=UPI001E4F888B|nr:hypothetical protein [Sphingobium sp. CCH11-B1]